MTNKKLKNAALLNLNFKKGWKCELIKKKTNNNDHACHQWGLKRKKITRMVTTNMSIRAKSVFSLTCPNIVKKNLFWS